MDRFISSLFLAIFITACCFSCDDRRNTPVNSSIDTARLIETTTSYVNGKQTFLKYCAMCHTTGGRDDYFFDRIFERMPAPSEDYFIKFVGDSKSLKEKGDQYTNERSGIYSNNSFEHNFKDSLSNKNFKDLIIYIRVKTKQPKK